MENANSLPVVGVDAQNDSLHSRRGVLGKAMLAGLASVPVVGLMTSSAKAFTVAAVRPAEREAFTDIRLHENDHVAFLKKALGSKARPKPTFKGLNLTTFDEFIAAALAFEITGVGAYLGALPAIKDKGYVAAAGSIALVEARHSGFLTVFAGRDITTQAKTNKPAGFDVPLTQAEVVKAVSPYIVSLNGGPAAAFTAGDDISILNFALLLEYLEAEYYNINIPKFFPGG